MSSTIMSRSQLSAVARRYRRLGDGFMVVAAVVLAMASLGPEWMMVSMMLATILAVAGAILSAVGALYEVAVSSGHRIR